MQYYVQIQEVYPAEFPENVACNKSRSVDPVQIAEYTNVYSGVRA